MRRIFWFMLLLCGISVNVHAVAMPDMSAPGGVLHMVRAGFPISLDAVWNIISSTGFINLVLLAVAWFAKSDAVSKRWSDIITIGYNIVNGLISSGEKDPTRLINIALKLLVDEINHRPDIKSLSASEVEKLQPVIAAYARRAIAAGTSGK